MSKALEAAADMIASFDRIKDDPAETLRAIFANLIEDEQTMHQLREAGTAALSGTGSPDPDYYDDFDLMFRAALRTLAGKE